jgi:hypothetical protein
LKASSVERAQSMAALVEAAALSGTSGLAEAAQSAAALVKELASPEAAARVEGAVRS